MLYISRFLSTLGNITFVSEEIQIVNLWILLIKLLCTCKPVTLRVNLTNQV